MITLGLQITNWCDQQCPHCMSRASSSQQAYNFMPTETVNKIITEFKQIEMPKWEDVIFTGGECMAPYAANNFAYMDELLNAVYKNGMFAKFNTNGIWATKELLCQRCLYRLAGYSYNYNKPLSLNLAVDEYHKNTNAVLNILKNLARNEYLSNALQVNIATFNTPKSQEVLNKLMAQLQSQGVKVSQIGAIIGLNDSKYIQCFNKELLNIGRAFDNNVSGAVQPSGHPSKKGDLLVVDNKDTATLNYKWSEDIKGRSLSNVYNALLKKRGR